MNMWLCGYTMSRGARNTTVKLENTFPLPSNLFAISAIFSEIDFLRGTKIINKNQNDKEL